jgi:hypothetical protein
MSSIIISCDFLGSSSDDEALDAVFLVVIGGLSGGLVWAQKAWTAGDVKNNESNRYSASRFIVKVPVG